MATLDGKLRRQLEHAIAEARTVAEDAAWAAMQRFAVTLPEPFPGMSHDDRMLRVWLREQARQLSGTPQTASREDVRDLVEACAYEHWHRMLFARFLAENGLLIHPEYGMPVTLAECAELAQAEGHGNGTGDGWLLAARYAAHMLPGLFRANDPYLAVPFATDDRQRLEVILAALPAAVFTAEDALGWVYQFWQAKRKQEINASGAKIDNGLIAPVTQLFSEPYMVEFLLHNTLGAWWAARHPDSDLNATFTYLRRTDDGTPICGTFPQWPDTAAALTVLDPCAGSGHFLQRAFHMLREMRMREENLSAAAAGDKVLEDNLFGLEIDDRCTQLTAFALALAAWQSGGYRPLPLPHVACSGIVAAGGSERWKRAVSGDTNAEYAMEQVYRLFEHADDLGSLIRMPGEWLGMFGGADVLARVQPLLENLLERTSVADDPTALVFGERAAGAVAAARLLLRRYHLVASNVPFLARGSQSDTLRGLIAGQYPDAKTNYATAMLERARDFCYEGGAYALVTPQNWLFLGSYKKLRERLLKEQTWCAVARLGADAFTTPMYSYNIALLVLANARPPEDHTMHGLDAAAPKDPAAKAALLRAAPVSPVPQAAQLRNPDARISLDVAGETKLLAEYADSYWGLGSGDYPRFGRCFWELKEVERDWIYQLSTVPSTMPYGGREHVLYWQNGKGDLVNSPGAFVRATHIWGKQGVLVSQMRDLPVTFYTGEAFDTNSSPIIPKDPAYLPAIWAFCSSLEFNEAVRRIDQKMNVMSATLVKVPFDLAHWQAVAAEQYPDGLPEPHSDDPTQWLFKGHIATSTDPLQVAVARLLGYRWPDQPENATLDAHADADGIVCIPPVRGEAPGAERVRGLLAAAYGNGEPLPRPLPHRGGERATSIEADGEDRDIERRAGYDTGQGAGHAGESDDLAASHPSPMGEGPGEGFPGWSPAQQDALLAGAGYAGKGLEAWLRDGFFAAHCARFGNRPFIWHLWDGRKDGFAALVNYHTLDRQKLEKLAYTYLGDWLERQRGAARAGEPGAEARVAAAEALQRKLALILDGEPPYDLFVRWKPLYEQPIGWNPDSNDGVRLNVRPFVRAGVLRGKFTVGWKKDRGENPPSLQFYRDGTKHEADNPGAVGPWVPSHREPEDLPGRKPNERHNDFHFTRTEKQRAKDAHDAATTPTLAKAQRQSPLDIAAGGGGGSAGGSGGGAA